MVQIEMTPEECQVLVQVLERRVGDLELEIRHTDHADFRGVLKQRLAVLQRLLERVKATA